MRDGTRIGEFDINVIKHQLYDLILTYIYIYIISICMILPSALPSDRNNHSKNKKTGHQHHLIPKKDCFKPSKGSLGGSGRNLVHLLVDEESLDKTM